MVSLDQVLLLEQKVESAVAKIAQLQAENDALRSKCSELTNALSSKSEQLSSFELDQNKIESGILNALNRLNSIENTVLNAAGQIPVRQSAPVQSAQPVQRPQTASQPVRQVQQAPVTTAARPVSPAPAEPVTKSNPETTYQQPVSAQFYDMPEVQQEQSEPENTEDQGQFDIF